MKVICKSCNTEIDSAKGIFSCNICGESYDMTNSFKPDSYSVKYLNGLRLDNLSYDKVKDSILTGKILSVDYITYSGYPWVKLKESSFGSLFTCGGQSKGQTKGASKIWMYLCLLSILINILFVVYFFIK